MWESGASTGKAEAADTQVALPSQVSQLLLHILLMYASLTLYGHESAASMGVSIGKAAHQLLQASLP